MTTTDTRNKDLFYFENALKEQTDLFFENLPQELAEGIKYAVMGGGKRIRPQLCFMSARFLDIDINEVIDFAIAIEFIHTYSLIHDDLPGMDNDDFRRSKPTVHKAYGECNAILAGDALLNAGMEILLKKCAKSAKYAKSCRFIASCAGANGMIGGQAWEFSLKNYTKNDIIKIAMKKTAALITASVMAPALISNDTEKMAALNTYSQYLGLCFQIADDIIDVNKHEQNSFVTVCGMEETKKILKDTTQKAVDSLIKWDESAELIEFCKKLSNRNK